MGIKRGWEEHKSQVLGNEMFKKIFAGKKSAAVRNEDYYTTKYFVVSSGRGSVMVKASCCKAEGRGFKSR
jgi:hypothetical protein